MRYLSGFALKGVSLTRLKARRGAILQVRSGSPKRQAFPEKALLLFSMVILLTLRATFLPADADLAHSDC